MVDIAEKVGLKAPRTREPLKLLTEERTIEALGSNRNRRYKKIEIDK